MSGSIQGQPSLLHHEAGDNYFTNAQGKEVYLAGSHTWTNVQDLDGRERRHAERDAQDALRRDPRREPAQHHPTFGAARFAGPSRPVPPLIQIAGVSPEQANEVSDGADASPEEEDQLLDSARKEPLHELVNYLLRSPMGKRDWPLRFYSRERLFSVEARKAWLEPDLVAFPSQAAGADAEPALG